MGRNRHPREVRVGARPLPGEGNDVQREACVEQLDADARRHRHARVVVQPREARLVVRREEVRGERAGEGREDERARAVEAEVEARGERDAVGDVVGAGGVVARREVVGEPGGVRAWDEAGVLQTRRGYWTLGEREKASVGMGVLFLDMMHPWSFTSTPTDISDADGRNRGRTYWCAAAQWAGTSSGNDQARKSPTIAYCSSCAASRRKYQ